MTNTKPEETTNETSTVVVDDERQTAKVISPKHKANFIVRKLRSSLFFEVVMDNNGSIPKVLSGKYTSLPRAIADIQQYIRQANESFAVKSDRLAEYRKNAKSKSTDD